MSRGLLRGWLSMHREGRGALRYETCSFVALFFALSSAILAAKYFSEGMHVT